MSITLLGVIQAASFTLDTTKSLREFIKDEMPNILREMGNVELTVAIKTLEEAWLSNDTQREISRTISHLQSAAEAFEVASTKEASKFFFNDWDLVKELMSNKRMCMLLITICYYHLGDTALVQRNGDRTMESCYGLTVDGTDLTYKIASLLCDLGWAPYGPLASRLRREYYFKPW